MNQARLWQGHIAQLRSEKAFHTKRLRFQERQLAKTPTNLDLQAYVTILRREVKYRQHMINRAQKLIKSRTS